MILPAPSAFTEEYWEAAHTGRLLLRYCESCAMWLHPRRAQCPNAHVLVWRAAQGVGTLVAHAVIHLELNAALRGQTPYTVTLTRLVEGPQILTSMPGETRGLACGMKMRVTYDRIGPHVTLPRFVPDAQTGS